MSHVDDGTLHAYLDGELPPGERDRVAGHLAECGACRGRLEEEGALSARARDLLDRAAPPRPIREPARPRAGRARRWPALRVPLAWAATLVLAYAIGWYAQGERQVRQLVPAATPEQHARPGTTATAPGAPLALKTVPRREARNEAPRAAEPARQLAPLAVESSRFVLGQAPAVLPNRPVLRTTLTPDGAGMVIEQELEPGTIIRLYERRADAAASGRAAAPKAAARPAPASAALDARGDEAERLARYVGALRVEIAGPLETDSLEKLLEQVR